MFSQPDYVKKLQEERRLLSIHNQQLIRVHLQQKDKSERLRKKLKEQYREILDRDKMIKRLEDELKNKVDPFVKTSNYVNLD